MLIIILCNCLIFCIWNAIFRIYNGFICCCPEGQFHKGFSVLLIAVLSAERVGGNLG